MGGVKIGSNEYITIGGLHINFKKISNRTNLFKINKNDEVSVQQLKQINSFRYAFAIEKIGNFIIIAGGRQFGEDNGILPSAEM